MKSAPLLALLLLLLPAMARAELQWASPQVFTAADPSEPRATAQFTFTNTGAYPIKVTGVHTTCGCTAAVNDGRPVAPGQKGTINVSFKTLNRHGLYGEPIVIDTNDPKTPHTTVNLRVLVRDAVEVLPRLLFWQPGEALTAKVIRITIRDGFKLRSITALCPDPAVQIQLDATRPGVDFKLTVTPKAPHVKAAINLKADLEGKTPRVITAYVRVS